MKKLGKITKKLIALQLFILFTVLLGVIGMGRYTVKNNFIDLQKEHITHIANDIDEDIEKSLQHIKKKLTAMNSGQELRIYNENFEESVLDSFLAKYKNEVEIITYIDKDGFEIKKIISQKSSDNLFDFKLNPLYAKSLKFPNQILNSKIKYNETLKTYAIEFVYLNKSYFGDNFHGILHWVIPISEFLDDDVQSNENLTFRILGKNKRVQFSTNRDEITKYLNINASIETKKFGEMMVEAKETFSLILPFFDNSSSIIISYDYDFFMKIPTEQLENLLKVFLVVMLLSIILTYNFSLRITEPIYSLIKSINLISKEHSDKKNENQTDDEIKQLADDFEFMTQRLNISKKEVEEKTKKLSFANEELQQKKEKIERMNQDLECQIKEKTAQIKEQKDAFENLFQKSSDGILIIKNGKFIDCNEAIVRMLKYNTKDELLHTSPADLSPKYQPDGQESQIKADKIIKRVLDTGSYSFEWVHKKSDGEHFWVEIVLTKMMQNSEDIIHVSWRDINQRKEIEFQLEQLSKHLENRVEEEVENGRKQDNQLLQQSKMAQMGEMLSMIAHQWRQPLSAINATSIGININARFDILNSQDVIVKTEKISEYSQDLSDTIEDFRDFFKVNRIKEKICYDNLIKSVLNIVELSLTNKDIKLIQELNCTEEFETYPNEIKHVILNLLRNSEDIILEKKIQNPFIKIQTFKENNSHILQISDNGGGIDEEIIGKIFDPYFSTKDQKNGAGLGLYMSKTIIEDHCKGKLKVTNNDVGAVFKIIL